MLTVSEDIASLKPYSPGKSIEEIQRKYGLEKVYKLASNESPLGPSPQVLAAIQNASHFVHRYPDSAAFELRCCVEELYGVDGQNVVFGNGSNELIDMLIRLMCEPGDKIVTTQAGFIAYRLCAQVSGVSTVEIPLTEDFRFDLAALADYLLTPEGCKARVAFVPNPNNPTGTYVSRQELDKLLSTLSKRQDLLLVLDEAYFEFVRAPDYPNGLNYLKIHDNIVVLRTLSKAYGLAGLRLGMLFGPVEVVQYLQRIRHPFNVNTMAQKAAIAALKDVEHLRRSCEAVWRGLDWVTESLKSNGFMVLPSQGNFVLFDTFCESQVFAEELMKRGVIVRPVNEYGFSRHIRMSIGKEEENRFALEKITEVSNELKSGAQNQ